MRFAGFSLVGILVVVGILMLIQNFYTIPMARSGKSARDDAMQLAGTDDSGMRTTESIAFSGVMSGQRLKGVQVDSVVMGGPMNRHFGLLPGDVVTGVKELPDLDLISSNDPETAAALVLEAYQRSQNLTVQRPGVGSIELPRDAAMVPPAGQGPQTVQTPVAPAPQPQPTGPQLTIPTPPTGPGVPPRRPTVWDRLGSDEAE